MYGGMLLEKRRDKINGDYSKRCLLLFIMMYLMEIRRNKINGDCCWNIGNYLLWSILCKEEVIKLVEIPAATFADIYYEVFDVKNKK